MVKGTDRKKIILKELQTTDKPVTCKILAQICDVSRQVIVQDVALLRAEGQDIISTNIGYILNNRLPAAIFKVSHNFSSMEDELFTIVDLGGTVDDIVVDAPPYGKIRANLNINSRIKAKDFLASLKENENPSLESLTNGVHYHTIYADSDKTLEIIRQELNSKGYLRD